jgi:hypothetical protein
LALATGRVDPESSRVTVPAIAPEAAEFTARSQCRNVNSRPPKKSYRKLRPRSKSSTMSAPSGGTSIGDSTRAYNGISGVPVKFCQLTVAWVPLFQVIDDKSVLIVMRTARYWPAGIAPSPTTVVSPCWRARTLNA